MANPRKHPLRPLTDTEKAHLARVTRSMRERAERVARAKVLLAVADGATFSEAAQAAGRSSAQGVGKLVVRFNEQGLAALDSGWGGGPPLQYGPAERARILQEVRRTPDRERDGTATWSLTTLQWALRRAPDGLPKVSTRVILETLWEAGYRWQRDRTWCHTGEAQRQRRDWTVVTTDPDTAPKKKL